MSTPERYIKKVAHAYGVPERLLMDWANYVSWMERDRELSAMRSAYRRRQLARRRSR